MRLKRSPLPIMSTKHIRETETIITINYVDTTRDWKNTNTNYVDIHEIEKFTTTNYVNITEYVYFFYFLSLQSVSYSLVVFVTSAQVSDMNNYRPHSLTSKCRKIRLCLIGSHGVWRSLLADVPCLCHILHKSYWEELSISWCLKKID